MSSELSMIKWAALVFISAMFLAFAFLAFYAHTIGQIEQACIEAGMEWNDGECRR